MIKLRRRNLIILLSAVLLAALSFFTASSTIKAKAGATVPGKVLPPSVLAITECTGIPEDAELMVEDENAGAFTSYTLKRYVYFQFNGKAANIGDTGAHSGFSSHIDITAGGVLTVIPGVETTETSLTKTLESGKYYCIDVGSILNCSVCQGTGDAFTFDFFYISNTAPTPVSTEPEIPEDPISVTEVPKLPTDAIKIEADFDTDGSSFNLKSYIYFKNDGTKKEIEHVGNCKHLSLTASGELTLIHPSAAPTIVTLELNKFYGVDASRFKTCGGCAGVVHMVTGDLYASDTAPSDISTEPETPAIEEPELTVIKGIPTNGIAVVASELNDGDVVIEKVTKRYIHFKNDGTAKKITDMWDKNEDPMGENLNSVSVSDSDVLTIKFKNTTFTKNLERDKFYSLDLNNFNTDGHAWYLSVYELVGEFYTSDEPAEYKATITFDMNGHGDQVAPLKIDLETAAGNFAFATPTAAGYWFVGWYKEDNKSFTNSEVLNENITLRAEWVKKGFATEVVTELPANARKIKVGDVLTGKTIYLVGTEDGKQSGISCESAYTENIGNVRKERLQTFISNNYRDLIYWSFAAFWQHTDKGYSSEFDINVETGKVLKIDYTTYELGTVTGISDENSLNLYIVDENGGTVDPGDQDNPNPGDNTGDNSGDIINDAGNWIKDKAEALSEWFKKQGVAVSSTGIIAITVIAVVVIVLGRKRRR